jgi:hypothetical protein
LYRANTDAVTAQVLGDLTSVRSLLFLHEEITAILDKPIQL